MSSLPPEPNPPLTPGDTQAERTRLAWRRTTLSATLAVLLLSRLAFADGANLADGVALFLAAVCWLVFLMLTHSRIRAMAHRVPAGIGRTLPLVGLTIAGLAALGIALVLIVWPVG